MSDTVMLSVLNDKNELHPFALIPFPWVEDFGGKTQFNMAVPPDPVTKNSTSGQVSISMQQFTFYTPDGGAHPSVTLVINHGAEYLFDHSHVAFFPRGMEIVKKRVN